MIKNIIKILIAILFIFTCIHIASCETVYLPYTEESNQTYITSNFSNINYQVMSVNDNEIYSIEQRYKFGLALVSNGVYISNSTFVYENTNITISEKYNITSGVLYKNVKYTLNTYNNNVLDSTIIKNYNVYITSPFFSKTEYIYLGNEIQIINSISTVWDLQKNIYNIELDKEISLNNINLSCDFTGFNGREINIEYVKTGVKPSSYYINQLNPILQYPYRMIKGFDDDNNFLNFLLIISYLIKVLFFWSKVLYQSLFTIIIIILIGVIPFISYSKSRNRNDFIDKLGYNYQRFFNLCFKFVKYMIDLIIRLFELIPFI